MEPILRALAIYFFLLLITRISGRRTLSEMTVFDFVLLLVIGEATQQGLLGDDFSVTNAIIVISTLVLTDVVLSLAKRKFPRLDKWLDGTPTILVKDGRILAERLRKARIDKNDILESARQNYGISCFENIEHAVLEKDGAISVIARAK
jgi:uncharacterized membrane protein YcaP (DUF421 family)